MTAKKTTAELGTEQLLRPAWNFEQDYDGAAGQIPILFTWPTPEAPLAPGVPDLSVLDDEARANPPPDGISPVLAKFVPVACGSTMLFFIPIVPASLSAPEVSGPVGGNQPDVGEGDPVGPQWMYVWRIVFRWRSVLDWVRDKTKRKPFQMGQTALGCPDSRTELVAVRNLPVAGRRYVMPVTGEAVIYGKPEENMFRSLPLTYPPPYGTILPDGAGVPASFTMVSNSPLYPGASLIPASEQEMDYQQGVLDPLFPGITPIPGGSGFRPTQATHLTKWIKSAGNEYAIEVYKFNYVDPASAQTFTPRAWDFDVDPVTHIPQSTGEDYPFSVMFGIGGLSAIPAKSPAPHTGVRVVSGLAPL